MGECLAQALGPEELPATGAHPERRGPLPKDTESYKPGDAGGGAAPGRSSVHWPATRTGHRASGWAVPPSQISVAPLMVLRASSSSTGVLVLSQEPQQSACQPQACAQAVGLCPGVSTHTLSAGMGLQRTAGQRVSKGLKAWQL